MRTLAVAAIACVTGVFGAAASAEAQNYPTRAVRIIAPSASSPSM